MHQMNKGRPDLNLLVIFDAVQRHRQVTAAARELSLSQPAVSHALNRLRDLVADPLFIRTPGGLVTTPRADQMAPTVRRLLNLSVEAFGMDSFDPQATQRTFRIGVSEYAMHTNLPPILQQLRISAPHANLEMDLIGTETLPRLETGVLDCTFWGATPPQFPFEHTQLYTEHFVGFICRNHPLGEIARTGRVTLDEFLAYPHAIVRMNNTGASPLDQALQKIGRTRRVILGSSSFASNLASLPGTDLIFSVPSRFAPLAHEHHLVGFDLPVEVPAFRYSLVWHNRMEADKAFHWFRDLIVSSLARQTATKHSSPS